MKKKLLHKILNYLLRRYYNAVTKEDIFVTDLKSGIIMYKGRELPEDLREKIGRDSELFLNSKIWHLLRNEIEYQAAIKALKTSQSEMDLLFGKAMLHSVKVMEERLKQMSTL